MTQSIIDCHVSRLSCFQFGGGRETESSGDKNGCARDAYRITGARALARSPTQQFFLVHPWCLCFMAVNPVWMAVCLHSDVLWSTLCCHTFW